MENNIDNLKRALNDLEVMNIDAIEAATNIHVLLSKKGYSLFWGTNTDGESYLEWYNDKNHSITLNIF